MAFLFYFRWLRIDQGLASMRSLVVPAAVVFVSLALFLPSVQVCETLSAFRLFDRCISWVLMMQGEEEKSDPVRGIQVFYSTPD